MSLHSAVVVCDNNYHALINMANDLIENTVKPVCNLYQQISLSLFSSPKYHRSRHPHRVTRRIISGVNDGSGNV